MFRNITIKEYVAMVNEVKIELIDIRKEEKYSQGHMMNSINIPVNTLLKQPEKYLTKNKEYYLISQNGTDGVITGRQLSNMGYNIVNIVGGYNHWKGKLIP